MFQNCKKVLSNFFMITILLLSILRLSHCQTNFSTEVLALMDFKASNAANSTSVSDWTLSAGSDNCKPKPWKGLKCWSSGFVRWVQLPSASLSGNISSSLSGLSSLTRLDLRNNQLVGGIPADLGPLVHLKKLLLSGNKLVGSIPAIVGNMTALEELDLGDNNLEGIIPSEIFARLTHLGRMDISNNQLTGPLPETLTNTTSLSTLLLGGNKLSGPVPSSLASSASLHTVDLSGNSLTGALPLNWTASNLTSLILSGNQLEGQIPLALLNLSSLVSLALANNNFSGTVPSIASCRFGDTTFVGNPELIVQPCGSSSDSSALLLPVSAPRQGELPAQPPIVLLAPVPIPAVPQPLGPLSVGDVVMSPMTDSNKPPKSRVLLILVVVAANLATIIVAAVVITLVYVLCRKRQQVKPTPGSDIHSKDSHREHRLSTYTYSMSRTPPDSARTSDFRASIFSECPSSDFEKSSIFQLDSFRNDQPELHLFQDETFTR